MLSRAGMSGSDDHDRSIGAFCALISKFSTEGRLAGARYAERDIGPGKRGGKSCGRNKG